MDLDSAPRCSPPPGLSVPRVQTGAPSAHGWRTGREAGSSERGWGRRGCAHSMAPPEAPEFPSADAAHPQGRGDLGPRSVAPPPRLRATFPAAGRAGAGARAGSAPTAPPGCAGSADPERRSLRGRGRAGRDAHTRRPSRSGPGSFPLRRLLPLREHNFLKGTGGSGPGYLGPDSASEPDSFRAETRSEWIP